MNSFADRFAATSPLAELRKAQANVEDDEFSDAAWGSEAGFGSLAKGVPAFTVPNVPDVRMPFCVCAIRTLYNNLQTSLLHS